MQRKKLMNGKVGGEVGRVTTLTLGAAGLLYIMMSKLVSR